MKTPLFVILCLLFLVLLPARAQTDAPSPIVFIYDSSGSMWGQIEGRAKVEIARQVMATTAGRLPEGQKVGLIAYGHRNEGDCRDVETLLLDADPADMAPALEAIRPLGKTPLAYSATQVFDRLTTQGGKATIILLTDGIESCDGFLCDVVRDARNEGIEFVLHIVGFGIKEGETGPLRCAAEAGGGRYFDAESAAELAAGLHEAAVQTVDLAPNVSLEASKNGAPLDAYIEAFPTGESDPIRSARSYHKGALFHLPAGTYDLKVSALENTDLQPIWLRDVRVLEDELRRLEARFDAGIVRFLVKNNDDGWDALVTLLADGKPVAKGRTYGRAKEMQVPPGTYSAEVKALAVEGTTTSFQVSGIEVAPAETRDVVHTFATGIAMIGIQMGEELVDAVVNITDQETGQGVAGARTYTSPGSNPRRFVLTPGKYTVKYSTLGEHRGHGDTFEMTIEPGATFARTVRLP